MADHDGLPPEDLEAREEEFERYYRTSKPLTEEEAALFYFTHTPLDLPIMPIPLTGRRKPKCRRDE